MNRVKQGTAGSQGTGSPGSAPAPNLTEFLTPDMASSLGRLDLVARRVVEGFITGLHRSPYHGFSVEFSEHRPYIPGDSLRDLDWKALAKSDRLYVKQYEEETNLQAYLIVDTSGSMDFATDGRLTKFRYATCLAAALGLLMLRQRDAVGLALVDESVRTFVRPRSVNSHLRTILLELTKAEPAHETHLAASLHDLAERLSRRGLVILLSDMLDDPAGILSGLRHFRHRGHEVVAMQILDPRERDLDFRRSDTRFVDLEGAGDDLTTQPWHIQEAYQQQMDQFLQGYVNGCADAGVDYILMDTQTPFDLALSRYLVRRRRVG